MENSDQKNSVPTEQFDKNAENANYEDIKNVTTVPVDETANADIELVDKPLKKQKAKPKVEGEAKIIDEAKSKSKSKSKSKVESKSKSKSKVLELDNEEDATKGVSNKELILTNETQPVKNSDEKVIIKSPGKSDNENIPELSKEEEKIDYTKLSREDIVKVFKDILDKPVSEIREEVDIIKINFYKKHKQYTDKLRANFLKEGGLPEDFKPQEDIVEDEFKELLNKFKSLKSDLNKQLEVEKEANLDEKYKIIEEIKDLINRKESINRTFNEFRELQRRWREIGLVPQQKVKDLWDTYHHHVEKFYDYIKINKELRDIDLKK
ncbi:MAG: DUF349 domain-containing protein, partial [Bacteroidales bacterium]|nr:DUF349 domain-containing protein [Bacteroidales bacterium]